MSGMPWKGHLPRVIGILGDKVPNSRRNKCQHAPWHPEPVNFRSVFEDVIRARVDGAELYRLKTEGAFPFSKVVGKDTIRRLTKGEEVRCFLWPVEKPAEGLARLFPERTT